MSNELFRIQNLHAHIPSTKGPIVVVDGVTLSIQPGECFGLLGESGCGKTSLINAALGFSQITNRYRDAQIKKDWIVPVQTEYFSKEEWARTVRGEVIYRGIDLLSLSPAERAKYLGRHIGYIPQGLQGALTPIFSIGEQTGEPLEIHNADLRTAKMHERVLEYLNIVSLAEVETRYVMDPTQFSGGEAQRILIAMSLIAGPHLVIADEPTSALDVTIQSQVLGVFEMVKKEFDVALMVVSHDAGVIAELADRVGVMYAGRIMEVGGVTEMFHNPRHPYTFGLMNSFPTIAMMRMAAGGKRPMLRGISGSPPDPRNLPAGCTFHSRCPYVMEVCVTKKPELRDIEEGHQVACHRVNEISCYEN